MAIPDDPPPGVPEWVVTYGDMMSLLLTFFIMLVSMSETKQDGKMRAMLDSMEQRFGADSVGNFGVPGPSLPTSSNNEVPSSDGARNQGGTKKGSADSAGASGRARTVKRINHGTQITLGGPCVFPPASAEMTEDLKQDLASLSEIMRSKPHRIMVRGHATREPLPAGSPWKDAWELSFARAQVAAEALIASGIDRRRVLVGAAGDTEPRVISRDKAAQAANHRVDVFVIDAYTTPSRADETGKPPEK